jgi:hypothetical protein
MQLVAQHKNLKLLRALRAQPKHTQLEQTPQHPVHERDKQTDSPLPVDRATYDTRASCRGSAADANHDAPGDQPTPTYPEPQSYFRHAQELAAYPTGAPGDDPDPLHAEIACRSSCATAGSSSPS